MQVWLPVRLAILFFGPLIIRPIDGCFFVILWNIARCFCNLVFLSSLPSLGHTMVGYYCRFEWLKKTSWIMRRTPCQNRRFWLITLARSWAPGRINRFRGQLLFSCHNTPPSFGKWQPPVVNIDDLPGLECPPLSVTLNLLGTSLQASPTFDSPLSHPQLHPLPMNPPSISLALASPSNLLHPAQSYIHPSLCSLNLHSPIWSGCFSSPIQNPWPALSTQDSSLETFSHSHNASLFVGNHSSSVFYMVPIVTSSSYKKPLALLTSLPEPFSVSCQVGFFRHGCYWQIWRSSNRYKP